MSPSATAAALELRSVIKEYEQIRVLKGVSLTVREGEIHALVGENGAGKSTLMNILFGMPVIWETGGYQGEVLLGGAPARFKSPSEAMDAGIGMVHQEFILLPGFRVAENIKLNREPTTPNVVSKALGKKLESLDIKTMRADARRALDSIRLGIVEWVHVAVVAQLRFFAPTTEAAISMEGLRVEMPGERVDDITLAVRQGEILGIGGLAGHGKLGIANGIMGLYPAEGRIVFNGKLYSLNDPRKALAEGLAFVSEDRRGVGLLPEESIELNIALSALEAQGRFLHPFPIPSLRLMDHHSLRAHANEMIRALDIRTTGPAQQVRRLSGGNQQQVCVARAMTLQPRLLFVSEPTRGIDVGAKERVLDILTALNRDKGVTLVVTSSELAELRAICDRVAIVYKGKIAAILPPDAPDAQFGLAMAGESTVAA